MCCSARPRIQHAAVAMPLRLLLHVRFLLSRARARFLPSHGLIPVVGSTPTGSVYISPSWRTMRPWSWAAHAGARGRARPCCRPAVRREQSAHALSMFLGGGTGEAVVTGTVASRSPTRRLDRPKSTRPPRPLPPTAARASTRSARSRTARARPAPARTGRGSAR